MLAGMALTPNAFSRAPNVLSILLLAAVIVDARRQKLPWRVAVAHCVWVLADYGPQTAYQNNAKLDVLNRWLLLKGYHEVWNNVHFSLYAAQ